MLCAFFSFTEFVLFCAGKSADSGFWDWKTHKAAEESRRWSQGEVKKKNYLSNFYCYSRKMKEQMRCVVSASEMWDLVNCFGAFAGNVWAYLNSCYSIHIVPPLFIETDTRTSLLAHIYFPQSIANRTLWAHCFRLELPCGVIVNV